MSMSDCYKCWSMPCACGYDYLQWTPESIAKLVATLQLVQAFNVAMPPPIAHMTTLEKDSRYERFKTWKKDGL